MGKKNLDQLYSPMNHPRIMPDNAYEILMERGQYLLSFGDDEYKDKDKYKYKIHKYSIGKVPEKIHMYLRSFSGHF